MVFLSNLKKIFNGKNLKKFWIVFSLSIIKTIFFVSLVFLQAQRDTKHSWRIDLASVSPVERTANIMSFILLVLFFSSLILRISFAWKLRDDEVLKQSGLDIKQYSIGFGLIPLITSILLITKHTRDKVSIVDFWTTKQLILKWKIINFIKDLIVLFWFFLIVAIIVSIFVYFNIDSSDNVIKKFAGVFFPALGFGILFILVPFFLLASYSLKIYREINNREKTNWTSVSYIFFLPFFYYKAWKNVLKLSSQIKTTEENKLKVKQEAEIEDFKSKVNLHFYKFSIIKNIFHFIFITIFTVTLSLIIPRIEILRDSNVSVSLFILLTLSFTIYFLYIVPRYLTDFVNSTKKPLSLVLYAIDIFIPIVSIYNLIKYKKNNTVLV